MDSSPSLDFRIFLRNGDRKFETELAPNSKHEKLWRMFTLITSLPLLRSFLVSRYFVDIFLLRGFLRVLVGLLGEVLGGGELLLLRDLLVRPGGLTSANRPLVPQAIAPNLVPYAAGIAG